MKRMSKTEIEEMITMYGTGKYNFKDLDIHFKRGLGTCRGLLLRRGYKAKSISEINRKYTLNESYFEKIDCEEKSYMLGFLYADGCNYPEGTRIVIGLHEKDKEILEKFKILLGYNRPLYYKKTKENEDNQYVLTISSKKISQDLEKLGMIKAKSLMLTFPADDQVPKDLIPHFIRGYFDGDGCITSSKSNIKWSILGTSNFLSSIQDIMVEKLQLNKTKIYKAKNIYSLEYKGRKQIKTIKEWLYNDATIFLERKYNKFLNYASS